MFIATSKPPTEGSWHTFALTVTPSGVQLSPTAMSQEARGKIASSAPDPFATPVQTRLSPRKILGWHERERDVEAETSVEDVHCESKWDYLSAGRFSSEPRVRPKRSVNSVTAC